MFAPAGQGKTFGAKAFLNHFYRFKQEKGELEDVQGFMISGQGIDGNYYATLRDFVGAGEKDDGWVHALLLALDEPRGRQPSILILDGFNSLGKEGVNEAFVKKLYGLIGGKKNLYVVLISSGPDVAREMCSWNNGQRIRPVPGTYTGKATAPMWNNMKWSRDELVQAVRYHFSQQFDQDDKFDFIVEEMTPLQAVMAADDSTRSWKVPDSLKKRPGSPKEKPGSLKKK
jgi:hypothetical protein